MKAYSIALLGVLLALLPFSPASSQIPEWVVDVGGHTGEIIRIIPRHPRSEFISCSKDGSIRIWDMESGKLKRSLFLTQRYELKSTLHAADLAPDHRTLAICGKGLEKHGVTLLDLETGAILDHLNEVLMGLQRAEVTTLGFSPSGNALVAGTSMGWVLVWTKPIGKSWSELHDPVDGFKPTLERHYLAPSAIEGIAFEQNRPVFYVGSYAGTIRTFAYPDPDTTSFPKHNFHNGKYLSWESHAPGHTVEMHCLGDSLLLYGVEKGTLQFIDLKALNKKPHTRGMGTVGLHALALNKSGNKLFIGGSMICENQVVDLPMARKPVYLPMGQHLRHITAAAFLTDSLLATGDHEGRLSLWNTNSGQLLKDCSGAGAIVRTVARTAEGQIAAGNSLNAIAIAPCAGDPKIVPVPFYNLDWVFDPHTRTIHQDLRRYRDYLSPDIGRNEMGGAPKIRVKARADYQLKSRLFGLFQWYVWKNKYVIDDRHGFKLDAQWQIYWFPPAYADAKKKRLLIPNSDHLRLLKKSKLKTFQYPASIAMADPVHKTYLSGGTDRVIRLYNQSRNLILSLFADSSDSWVIWAPDGSYLGRGPALHMLGWMDKGTQKGLWEFHPISQHPRAKPDSESLLELLKTTK